MLTVSAPPRLRLDGRFGFWITVIIGLSAGTALRWPALNASFFSDDFDHYAMQRGIYPVGRAALDMFNFSDGSPAENRALMEAGHFPWWSDPGVHLSMWRPFSSALIRFDSAAFGLDARLFHIHSLLWWAVLVVAVSSVLWQVLPKLPAALAISLFALEEGHGLPVAWPANRSTLIASAFGFFALALHLRWRASAAARFRAGFVACCVLALAAGEYAFTAFAYLAAYELLRSGATRSSVVHALWPAALVSFVYLVVRQTLGYGIDGSGFYISPSATPFAFLQALAWRIPVLCGDLIFGVTADWYVLGTPWRDAVLDWNVFSPSLWYALPSWHTVQIALGVVGLAALAAVVRFAPRLVGEQRARVLRWLVCGALLSLVPVAGSMVSSRLTVAASVGFDALYAELLAVCAVWLAGRVTHPETGANIAVSRLRRTFAAVSCGLLLWVHGYRSAERSHDEADWYRFHADMERDWIREADLDDARVAGQDVVVFAATDLTTAWYAPYLRALEGRPRPRSMRLLSGAPHAHDLFRIAPNAFELAVLTSDVERMAAGSNYRPNEMPMAVGDEVKLRGMHVKVVSVRGGQPVRTRFTFDAPLEDPHYVFLHPTERGLRRVHMPAVGERIRLKRPAYPSRQALAAEHAEREASRRAGFGGALAPIQFELFRP